MKTSATLVSESSGGIGRHKLNSNCIMGGNNLRFKSDIPYKSILTNYQSKLSEIGWSQSGDSNHFDIDNVVLHILDYSSTNRDFSYIIFITVANSEDCFSLPF